MHDVLVALGSAAATWAIPKFGTAALRLVRGEAEREVGEIQRLVTRVTDLEGLVDLLRRLLDESLTRGSASTSMARILLFAVDQENAPSAAMIAARDHAREVIASAAAQLSKKRG